MTFDINKKLFYISFRFIIFPFFLGIIFFLCVGGQFPIKKVKHIAVEKISEQESNKRKKKRKVQQPIL